MKNRLLKKRIELVKEFELELKRLINSPDLETVGTQKIIVSDMFIKLALSEGDRYVSTDSK
jgi:hypothetical protein